jgi:DSF synthase
VFEERGVGVLDNNIELLQPRLRHLKVTRDPTFRAVWVEFKYDGRPCFTRELLDDVRAVQHAIRQSVVAGYHEVRSDRLLFQVVASTDSRVFSLGGDLNYFLELIEAGDRDAMRSYASTCIDIQYATATHYDTPFMTIALVEGEALGGGFEAALSANLLIAEPQARFGFPEISFGMFPGMGAVSLLARRVTPATVRKLIMNQRIYTAEELHELGVVDILASKGKGREATADYMRRHLSLKSGLHGFQAAADRVYPLEYNELADVVDLWVESAMQVNARNKRLMGYFARAQTGHSNVTNEQIFSGDYQSGSR